MVEALEKIEGSPKVLPVLERHENPSSFYDPTPSSLSRAEAKELYIPSKPVLENPIFRMIEQYVSRVEPSVDRWSRFKENTIEKKFKEVENLHIQEAKKMAEAQEAANEVSFWGILEDIGNSVMSATSFYFGFAAISAGAPIVGGALVISGVLSLSNLAFKHAHVWDFVADQIAGNDESLKETIRTYIPAAIGILSAAMGIYGSYASWKYAAETGIKQASTLLKSTANIATGLTAYTSGLSQYNLKNIAGDLSFLQSNMEFSKLSFERCVDDLKDFHEKQTQLHEKMGKIVEETDQAIQIIQQPV